MKFNAEITKHSDMNGEWWLWQVSTFHDGMTITREGDADTKRSAKRQVKRAAKVVMNNEIKYKEVWEFEL